MANLKILKTRIKSVRSTQKMTKAMKMVAASRLKKAKLAVEHSRPYAQKIKEMIVELANNVRNRDNFSEKFPLLTGRSTPQTYLLLVISSDRGLCGGLNSSTVKYTKNRVNQLIALGHQVKIFCVGRKAYEQIKIPFGDKIIERNFGIFKNAIDYKVADGIANKLVDLFAECKFDICEVIYSKFKSAIVQEQVASQIIPAKINVTSESEILEKNNLAESPIVYEPSQDEVLQDLLPKNISMQIYNFLLENNASEHGARMAAMESATNNAGKMIKNLTLVYNRTRQANITKELIDIISGANTV
jgi:F-type H+-transporting ATPase subunit gamma